jgi:nucleotide-binding universal stress UspA family protein
MYRCSEKEKKMAKKILLALDESENAMRAVEFVSQTFTTDHEVTILSVVLDTPTVCEMDSPSLTPYFNSQRDVFCWVEDQKKMMIEEAHNKAKKTLLGAGFDEKKLRTKIESEKKGIAKGVLEEATSGYDLLVMGRQGVAGEKDFLLGGVPQKIMQRIKGVSVLVVD